MSFNDHNSDAKIYILDCGIEEYNKQKILELCSDKNTVLFVDAKRVLEELHYDLNLDRGSVAAYARVFIASMLPDEVKKVLYIDSDTLIRGSLDDLYDTDLQPYIIGGVRDAFSVMNKRVFGIKRGELFINSGVLLIDLLRWRKEKIEDSIYRLLGKNSKFFQGDQGIINTIFCGNIKELPLKYNVMTYLYDFTYEEMMLYRKPDNYFEKKEIENAIMEPVIVHFSSSFRSARPWVDANACHNPYLDEWLAFYPNEVDRDTPISRFEIDQKGLLYGVRMLHAYIRPLVYLIKSRINRFKCE
jgi:lipopolysaccharide biosynthesis glycosyltransferase